MTSPSKRVSLCLVLAGCLVGVSLVASAAALPEIHSSQGKLLLTQLVSAPFPHPQRVDGREYKGQFFLAKEHYADSTVAIFIPRGFRETARIDFVVHFHGWKNHVAKVLEHYRLIEQFQESRRNALLVIPQGPYDAPDSFGGKLEDPDGFRRFMDAVMTTLKEKSSVTNRQS